MATVVMVYPRDGGTYGTNEDGSLVPFVAYGYVDVPGQVVSLYEDATAALLGSVSASATPEPSGTWVGWYRWDIPVANWTTAAGALVPVMAGRGAMAIPSLEGTHPIPAMAGSGAMADTSYTSATVFAVPVMGGKGAVLSVGITAAVGLPAMAGVGACDAPSIASDSTAPTVTAFTVGTPTGLVVPISSFTASDAVGVTGYIVTESSTAPAVGAAGWTGSAPSSYTCSGAGTFDLYPWAKDAAGNVSSVFATPRSVTVSSSGDGTDDFNRANGALGANWTAAPGNTAPTITSNAIVGTGSRRAAYYSGRTYTDNQWARLANIGPSEIEGSYAGDRSIGCGVSVRQSASADSCYFISVLNDPDEGDFTALYRRKDGANTLLGTSYGVGQRLEVTGYSPSVSLTVKDSAGTTRISYTDSSADRLASGSAGIVITNSPIVDTFTSGDL